MDEEVFVLYSSRAIPMNITGGTNTEIPSEGKPFLFLFGG